MTQVAVHVLRQLDVADSIDLARLASALSGLEPRRGAAVLRGPERSGGAGVMLRNEPLDFRMGRRLIDPFGADARVRIFDFGVIAVRFTFAVPVSSAQQLIEVAQQVAGRSSAFDGAARALWDELSAAAQDAFAPSEQPSKALIEDYTVFILPKPLAAADPVEVFAHVLLAESANRKLAGSLVTEIARRAIRYYEDDLVLVDYDTALLVEDTGGAELVDLFEIASAQLLELRYYDALLGQAIDRLSADVRRARTASWLFWSPFRGLARQAAGLALEVSEMNDRLERAITLVGDTYFVQVYREAALRFRLMEAGNGVRDKINMVARVAGVAQGEVQTGRGMALELLIVLLIAFEILIAIHWPGAH